jgi:hypothetical protein
MSRKKVCAIFNEKAMSLNFMKMKSYRSYFTILTFIILAISQVLAQPRGRGPGGFDVDEMIKREKQNVYTAISDLSLDQKLLLDGIYDEFTLSFKELRDEARVTRDFRSMRPKMVALRDEKDALIKDVLSEEQFLIYQGLIDKRRKQMQEGMQRRRQQQGSEPSPADSVQNRPQR